MNMDFQEFVDGFKMAATVMSVERVGDDHWGEIRIVKSNAMYKQIMGPAYRDGMLYEELIPKEKNFENFCYRCAVKKLHLHAYVETKSMGVWTDGTYIPLDYEDEKCSYFVFFFEFTKAPEAAKMSDLSIGIAPLVVQTCIKLQGAENYYEAMQSVITDVQTITDSFCSCIILIDSEKQKHGVLCSKFRNDEGSTSDIETYLTYEVVSSWEKTSKSNVIIINDEYEMQELEKINPIWKKSLCDAKVKSVILAPLLQRKKILGYLFITNYDTARYVELKEYIERTAFFLSAEIANNDLMERLEYMSNIDLLTGIKNRNSMNARVDWTTAGHMQIKAPFGVVFADLNGLKQCNDNGGHEAGDRLLRDAAALLKEVFGNYEIYRAGGDEFVIIAQDCQEEVFNQKVSELREKSTCKSNVCFAIGTEWTETDKDLRLCMHYADEAMYADKKKFYETHSQIQRR